MILLPSPFGSIIAWAFISLLFLVLLLNIFGLPANWINLGLIALWDWLWPFSNSLGIVFWIIIIILALLGEGMEFGFQLLSARKFGSSSSAAFAGMIGAIIGAFLLAPVFWGLGAFLGALAGAWSGCLLLELLKGRDRKNAMRSAFGAMLGQFMGTILKIGIGGAIIAIFAMHVLPKNDFLPPVPETEPAYEVKSFDACPQNAG